jgi:uncharacterized protein with von Willebrand factor type A (vWA) domain
MKKMIEIEIEKNVERLVNQHRAITALRTKIDRLETELNNLENGIQKTFQTIESLGTKGSRRDGLAETPESIRTKTDYNAELLKEKLRLTKQILDGKSPNIWIYVQSLLPDLLKDENLQ